MILDAGDVGGHKQAGVDTGGSRSFVAPPAARAYLPIGVPSSSLSVPASTLLSMLNATRISPKGS